MNQRTLPKFELIYFPIHGRAEMLRLTFALGQAEFTDVPVTDWATLKPQTPLGQVPVLKETQGEDSWLIPQSGAIIRHLGRVLNLYGQTEREHTIADYVLESAMDWRAKFIPVAFAKMFGTAQDVQDRYWNEQLASHLRTMDKLLASPSKSGPWLPVSRRRLPMSRCGTPWTATSPSAPSCSTAIRPCAPSTTASPASPASPPTSPPAAPPNTAKPKPAQDRQRPSEPSRFTALVPQGPFEPSRFTALVTARASEPSFFTALVPRGPLAPSFFTAPVP